ncbi:hypothetical protein ACG9H6_18790 [Acinetobacter baumannii]|uniref:hypothetical protein n=1 Tax=Acinetobacter baumannii TaxID=470 RepID=UPI003AF96C21
MDSDAIWTETEESRLKREDEVRMQELKCLFDLMDEREQRQQYQSEQLNEALRVLSWIDLAHSIGRCLACVEERREPIDYIEVHRKWLKAFRSAMPYLAKMLLATDASLLIRLRSTLDRYAEISYPNLLVMIQPKLQTLNSIEA